MRLLPSVDSCLSKGLLWKAHSVGVTPFILLALSQMWGDSACDFWMAVVIRTYVVYVV